MPHIPVLTRGDADAETPAVYNDFREQMALPAPPNFIMTLGNSRTALRGTWDLIRSVLVNGEVPRWKKEMIFVAISKDRNCQYCYAAHVACCRMLGVESGEMDRLLWDMSELADDELRDMIVFCRKCARDPMSMEHADYAALKRHKLTQSQITELVAMAALAVYVNIVADASAVEADAMFKAAPAVT